MRYIYAKFYLKKIALFSLIILLLYGIGKWLFVETITVVKKIKEQLLPNGSSSCGLPRNHSYFAPKRIALSHIETFGRRDIPIGFPSNYSTMMILSSKDYIPGKFLPMLDLRGHRFDDGTYAANVGFVGRFIPGPQSNFNRILGVNVYYDYLQGTYGPFNQLGAGIELLGRRWDFRANVYVPLATKERTKVCVFDDYIGDYIMVNRTTEFVSYGYNAEIGHLSRSKEGPEKFLFYAAIGIYYLSGKRCNQSMRGGRFRIRPQYKDYLALDLSVSYDSVFQTVYQGEIIVSLPLYQMASSKKKNKCTHGLTDRQIYQPVERYEVMTMGRCDCWFSNFGESSPCSSGSCN